MTSVKRKIVIVDWVDSCSFSRQAWRDVEESRRLTPSAVQSVGFLVHQDKSHLVITGSLDKSENANGCHTIPRGCITRIRRLK